MNKQEPGDKRKIKQKRTQSAVKARKKRRSARQKARVALEPRNWTSQISQLERAVVLVSMLGLVFLFSLDKFSGQSRISAACAESNGEAMSLQKINHRLSANPYHLPMPAEEPKPRANEELYQQVMAIVHDRPMAAMAEAIAERKRPVAAFLVGIAMKESKFGTYSPKKDGAECFNYWGYRGKENTTRSGYSCFASPEEAVRIVGDRIEAIVDQGAQHPAQMISWKCGRTCAGHSPESVAKWIADVEINYYKLNPVSQVAKR